MKTRRPSIARALAAESLLVALGAYTLASGQTSDGELILAIGGFFLVGIAFVAAAQRGHLKLAAKAWWGLLLVGFPIVLVVDGSLSFADHDALGWAIAPFVLAAVYVTYVGRVLIRRRAARAGTKPR